MAAKVKKEQHYNTSRLISYTISTKAPPCNKHKHYGKKQHYCQAYECHQFKVQTAMHMRSFDCDKKKPPFRRAAPELLHDDLTLHYRVKCAIVICTLRHIQRPRFVCG